MRLPLQLQKIALNHSELEIFVPDATAIQKEYSNNKEAAYWAQIWPASIGLCNFLQQHPQYIAAKNILELAAGLGLPGLYTASFANKVTITDREALASEYVQQSAHHLQLLNVYTGTLDWKDADKEPLPDTVLLSDVNYEPEVFEELLQVLKYFLQHKVTIIISTPQRLIAKQFINALLPYCNTQWNTDVELNSKTTAVSVFVLNN